MYVSKSPKDYKSVSLDDNYINTLPNELIYKIATCMDFETLKRFTINKKITQCIKFLLRESYLYSVYGCLVDAFTVQKLDKAPTLKFQPRFIGGIDYIDNIYPDDMKESIMVGVDNRGRNFISIRYESFGGIGVCTIFQRYPGCMSWVYGGETTFICESTFIIINNTPNHELTLNNISRLVKETPNVLQFNGFGNETREIPCKLI